MSPILTNHIDIITHLIWWSYFGHYWLFFARALKFDKLIWILLSLLPSRSWSSLWWQGQWIVSRLRLMEHGWRGRSCNQALRREEGPHLTLCNQALIWKEAAVLGASHRGRCEPGVSVNAIDENLYQILWIAPHRGCLTCCAWNWENTSNTNTSNTSRATYTHPATY